MGELSAAPFPQVLRPGVTTISQSLIPVQPMAPPSGNLHFTFAVDNTTKDYIAKDFEIKFKGNLFIVFYGKSLVQGAYLTYEEAQTVTTSNSMITPVWFNSDNNKLCRKLHVFYDEDRTRILVSRIESKIDTSWRDSLYKYRSTLILDTDSMCYAVETCENNPRFDILTELPNWVAKYGTPYH